MEKSTPSYMEYTVICENTADCWYIMVNVDGDDVAVPLLSTADIPPSQILTKKSWVPKDELQFFYFGPFDIYSKNTITGQINAVNPQIDPTEDAVILEEKEWWQNFTQAGRAELLQIFGHKLDNIKKYKQTEAFGEYKLQKSQLDITPQSNNWKYVPGSTTWKCNSRIPCYKQYNYNYGCAVWCSPVAGGMIMGYYDRNGKPNLVSGTALDVNNGGNNPTDNMIKMMRSYMWTSCINWSWSTIRSNVQNAKYYAYNNGYPGTSAYYYNTSSSPAPWVLAPMLTPEINAWRPLILHLDGVWNGNHSAVMYGYNMSNILQIKLNAGWGNGNTSSAVVTLWSFSLWGHQFNAVSYTKFTIQ